MRISIVGGGAVAVCSLDHIIENFIASGQEVVIENISIFEKGSEIGLGLAYSSENLLNVKVGSMYVRKSDPEKFLQFAALGGFSEDDFVPRKYFGKFLKSHLSNVMEKAKKNNIQVSLFTRCEIVDVGEDSSKYFLKSNDGTIFEADKIVLCLGNQVPDFGGHLLGSPGYFHEAYDIENITKSIPKTAPVSLIGCGLVSIDTILSLSRRGYEGPITCYSRTGLLPSVRPRAKRWKLKYLTREKLLNLTNQNRSKISYEDLEELFRNEFARLNISDLDIRNEIDRIARDEPEDVLRHNLNRAMSTTHINQYSSILSAIDDFIHIIWNSIPEQAQRHFLTTYKRIWDVYNYPMPLENAKKLKSLMESGILEVKKGLNSVEYSEKENCFMLYCNQNLRNVKISRARYVVNTTGQGINVLNMDNKLLRNLLSKGMIQSHKFGGILIEFGSSLAVPKYRKLTRGIYVIGSLTRGTYLNSSSMMNNTNAAELVARHLSSTTV